VRNFLVFCSEVLIEPGWKHSDIVCLEGEEWFLIRYYDQRVMVIRGTKGLREWGSNFRQGGWQARANNIREDYESQWPWGPPDFIVGHSRGGVLGLYLGSYWKTKVVAFSCPRVSKQVLDMAHVPLLIEATMDLVAFVPPWFIKPVPHVLIQIPGCRHSVARMEKIPDAYLEKVAALLHWNVY